MFKKSDKAEEKSSGVLSDTQADQILHQIMSDSSSRNAAGTDTHSLQFQPIRFRT